MSNFQVLNQHIGTTVKLARYRLKLSPDDLAERASAQLGETIEPKEIDKLEYELDCLMSIPRLLAIFAALGFLSNDFFSVLRELNRMRAEDATALDEALPVDRYPDASQGG